MPPNVKADYEEARTILNDSPRGSAALARLCIQKLCAHFGEDAKHLNSSIGNLVASRGLDPRVQKALDAVRIVGNNAVHPGELDLKDDRETASKILNLVNLVVDQMIAQPNHLDSLLGEVATEGELAQIEKRDSNTKK